MGFLIQNHNMTHMLMRAFPKILLNAQSECIFAIKIFCGCLKSWVLGSGSPNGIYCFAIRSIFCKSLTSFNNLKALWHHGFPLVPPEDQVDKFAEIDFLT